jgi:hypothetical protein
MVRPPAADEEPPVVDPSVEVDPEVDMPAAMVGCCPGWTASMLTCSFSGSCTRNLRLW